MQTSTRPEPRSCLLLLTACIAQGCVGSAIEESPGARPALRDRIFAPLASHRIRTARFGRIGGIAFSAPASSLFVLEHGEGVTIVDLRDSPVNPDAVGYVKIPGTVGEIALVNPSTLAICAQTDLLLCDLQLNKTVQTPCVGGRPVSIAVSPNADLIVCGTSAGWVVAFGSTDGALRWKTRISVHAFERDPQAISGVAFLDHGSTVAASSRDGHLHFLTSEDGSSLDSVQISARSLTAVATLGEGSRIATCGDEGLFTYDRSRGLVTHQKKQHRGKGVICLSTTRTGELLASSGLDHSVTLWRTRDMEPLCALEVEEIATALAFDEDGSRLAVGTESGLVLVLNLIEK